MKNTHYNMEKLFLFFALTINDSNNKYVYIGKTTARRISAVYSSHICGKIAATESYFDHDARPQLHILNELRLTTAQAYKYVVAYTAIFMRENYLVINHQATLVHAQTPKPETLSIIQALSLESVDNLLERTRIEKPSDADRPPSAKPTSISSPIQMNVRIKEADKQLFDRFRIEHHLNQSEAFSLLLDQATDKHYTDLLAKKDTKLQKLEKQIAFLQRKLEQIRTPTIPSPEQHARDFLHFAKQGITHYIDTFFLPENTTPLPRQSYRHFTRNLSDAISYEYPTSEGYSILHLERILWSNNRTRACFLLGVTSDGKKIKLRYYSKEYHLICSFFDSPHAYVGAKWLVGYRAAKDNAIELVLALPLCETQLSSEGLRSTQMPHYLNEKRKMSLQEQISKASHCK